MADTAAATSIDRAKAVVRRLVDDAWNAGRLEVLDELVAPQAAEHDPQTPFPDLRGPERFRRTITLYRSAFPDTHMTLESVVADDDLVASRWIATGTHEGELMGLAPTGRRVEVCGMSFDRVVDGLIVESWSAWDALGLMRRLGAAPQPGTVGERVGLAVQRMLARRERARP